MSKSAMPKSKAKTAYGLLSEIRKLILEEPKRYDQTAWKRQVVELPDHLVPACGTVCCVAGWVDTLKSRRPVPADRASFEYTGNQYRVAAHAARILGLNREQADTLFNGDAAGDRWRWNGFLRRYRLGVHARRGANHISRFMKANAAQLKAKRV